jgi:hypothetical protein
LPDHDKPTQQPGVDATRATAGLPGLDIEIVHRRSPGGNAEQISIILQAVPSFEAFSRFVDSANPFAFWAQATQMAWLPWHAAFQAMPPPGPTWPLLGWARRRAPAEPILNRRRRRSEPDHSGPRPEAQDALARAEPRPPDAPEELAWHYRIAMTAVASIAGMVLPCGE